MRRTLAAAAIAVTLAAASLGGCAVFSHLGAVNTVATELSTATPVQITSYGDALLGATLVTKATKIAVDSGRLNEATLDKISDASDAVHAEFVKIKTAHDAGGSLAYAALESALNRFSKVAHDNQVAIPTS